jgi:hypothetical protein
MITHANTPDEERAVTIVTDRLRALIGKYRRRHLNLSGAVFIEHGMRLHAAVQDLTKEGYVLTGLTLRFENTKKDGA